MPSDNDVYKSIPDSLSISTPEFENVSIISSGISKDGIAVEEYEYQNDYSIVLFALRRESDNQRPYIGEYQLTDFIEMIGKGIHLESQHDYEDNDGTLCEELRFKGTIDDKETVGAVCCLLPGVWCFMLRAGITANLLQRI